MCPSGVHLIVVSSRNLCSPHTDRNNVGAQKQHLCFTDRHGSAAASGAGHLPWRRQSQGREDARQWDAHVVVWIACLQWTKTCFLLLCRHFSADRRWCLATPMALGTRQRVVPRPRLKVRPVTDTLSGRRSLRPLDWYSPLCVCVCSLHATTQHAPHG